MAKAKTALDSTPKKKSAAKSTKKSNGSVEIQAVAQAPVDLAEEIRQRAYELYAERGFTNGNPEEDWLRAEAEVRARYPRSA